MPTYDYVCDACGHEFEHFQSITDAHLKTCPKCSKKRLVRKIGGGAGVIFKGSGFYETDYKRSGGSGGSGAPSAPKTGGCGRTDCGQAPTCPAAGGSD
jgi:putative FmdB family regulatory protein